MNVDELKEKFEAKIRGELAEAGIDLKTHDRQAHMAKVKAKLQEIKAYRDDIDTFPDFFHFMTPHSPCNLEARVQRFRCGRAYIRIDNEEILNKCTDASAAFVKCASKKNAMFSMVDELCRIGGKIEPSLESAYDSCLKNSFGDVASALDGMDEKVRAEFETFGSRNGPNDNRFATMAAENGLALTGDNPCSSQLAALVKSGYSGFLADNFPDGDYPSTWRAPFPL